MSSRNDMKKPSMKPMTSDTPRSSRRKDLLRADSRRHHRMAEVEDQALCRADRRGRNDGIGTRVLDADKARCALGRTRGDNAGVVLVLPVGAVVEVVAERHLEQAVDLDADHR